MCVCVCVCRAAAVSGGGVGHRRAGGAQHLPPGGRPLARGRMWQAQQALSAAHTCARVHARAHTRTPSSPPPHRHHAPLKPSTGSNTKAPLVALNDVKMPVPAGGASMASTTGRQLGVHVHTSLPSTPTAGEKGAAAGAAYASLTASRHPGGGSGRSSVVHTVLSTCWQLRVVTQKLALPKNSGAGTYV